MVLPGGSAPTPTDLTVVGLIPLASGSGNYLNLFNAKVSR